MSEESAEPNSTDASSSPSFEEPDPPEWEAGAGDRSSGTPSASFALDVARVWVRQHQKTTMLGAFAVGVFVGAMLRD